MTINHIFVWATAAKFQSLRSFYRAILQPVGYTEMICANSNTLIRYGSDYPYFWLKQLPEDKKPLPAHIVFDAPSREAVEQFYQVALTVGVTMDDQEYEKR